MTLQSSPRAFDPSGTEEFAHWLDGVRAWAGTAAPDMSGWRSGAALDLLALPVARGEGGAGAGFLATCRAFETAGEGAVLSGNNVLGGFLFAMSAHLWACQEPLLAFGTDEQRAAYLPDMMAGKVCGAFGATEDGAGSDVMSMRTRAVRTDTEGWCLNGVKTFVTNAPTADLFLVLARTSEHDSYGSLSAFLVPRSSPGLSVGSATEIVGPAGARTAVVRLADVTVGEQACLGGEGAGFAVLMHAMRHERAFILAPAVGLMAGMLRRTVEHARRRSQFGRPIATYDAVRERLVDAALHLAAAQDVLRATAGSADLDELDQARAALTKLHVSREFNALSNRLADVYGGYAMMPDTGIPQLIHDALASRFYSGTDDMQTKIIAEGLGL